jgi:nucleotide-binding universal stress UspA family protein
MLLFRTILHPTDFSPAAEEAFQLAASLARDHGARLVVLHVMPATPTESPDAEEEEVWLHKDHLWEEFHRLEATDPRIREVRIDCQFIGGDPAKEILRVAGDIDADLIVMGTHGRTRLSRLLMGSVAEMVSRKAVCPVLTMKAQPRFAPAPSKPLEELIEV